MHQQSSNRAVQCVLRSVVTLMCGVCTCASLSADEPGFRLARPILFTVRSLDSVVVVPLDSDIFNATRPDLADLRILDRDNVQRPYILERPREAETTLEKVRCAGQMTPEAPPTRDRTVVVYSLESGAKSATSITIESDEQNFHKLVTVEGSNTPGEWETLVSRHAIFDYSQFLPASRTTVDLPENTARRYRVTLEEPDQEAVEELDAIVRTFRDGKEIERVESAEIANRPPFRIKQLSFCTLLKQTTLKETLTRPYDVTMADAAVDDDGNTVVEFASRREPLTAITLETRDRNFQRTATLQAARIVGASAEWRTIARADIYRVSLASTAEQDLTIKFPAEERSTRYRVVIENRDNPPLTVDSVTASGPLVELRFIGQPDDELRLVYDSPQAPAPQYDIAGILSRVYATKIDPTAAALGPAAVVDVSVPAAAATDEDWFKDPTLLIAIVVILAAVLGFALFRAARRIDAVPKQDV